MKNRIYAVTILIFLTFLCFNEKTDLTISAQNLKCEYRVNPLGIDVLKPRLSWVLESTQHGQKQTAYQVLVSDDVKILTNNTGNIWDSGKIESNQTNQVTCMGSPFASQKRYYWKVRVWDKNGKASDWSETAWWETSFLSPKEWTAQWINDGKTNPERDEDFYMDDPMPLFRKEFQIDKPVKKARLYVSGLGYYEARLNGNRVGDHMLDPALTTYSKRVLYSTYDVTGQLRSGPNCLGAMLGNGWYNVLPLRMWGRLNLRQYMLSGRPRLIAQLVIEYTDGTQNTIVTDESWKVGKGPIIRNSIYLGEVYDARKEQEGWDQFGFNDAAWHNAKRAGKSIGRLEAQIQPPIKETVKFKPVKISYPKEGVAIVDLGQNIAGWATMRVKGPAGTTVKLRFGELLYPDGTLNVMTSVCGQIKKPGMGGPGAPDVAEQSDTYILKGKGEEVYTPRFTFHAFRYIEVIGYPGILKSDDIEGIRLNSAIEKAGSFSCSNDLFNRIQHVAGQTFPSNLLGVQSDCPGRERFGYGDDISAAAETHLYNYDMATFYTKTVRDFADAARPNGALTLDAPWTGHEIGGFDPDGGDFAKLDGGENVGTGAMTGVLAHPLLLDKLYQFYGDKQLLEEQYKVLQRSLEFIQSQADNFIIHVGLGDWLSLVENNKEVISTALFYHHAIIAARVAKILGHQEDAEKYTALSGKIKEAFIKKFLKPGTGQIDNHTQTAQVFALYYDLIPPDERQAAIDVLIDDILIDHKGHLSTGILGTKYLLEVLTQIGRADVAYKIVNQKTFPGWGYMLESGATTFWEVWNFSDNTYSHNHSMFGSVSAWFYYALTGIQPAPDAIGFDKIIIKPQVVGDLTWVKGTYNSIHGEIISNWHLEDGTFNLDVTIPVNTTATVFVPARDAKSVTEGGKPADQVEGVTFLRMKKGKAIYNVTSGSYTFTAKVNELGNRVGSMSDITLNPTMFTGVKSSWNGFDRYDFKFEGKGALVVVPKKVAAGRPWVWRARFFADPPEVDIELLKNGFHVAYIDLPGYFGSPAAMEIWDHFYQYLTENYNFSGKVALEGTSRGGLFVFNWAARNPKKVACIYADAPVCDIKSWPAGKLKGKANPTEWANLLKAYDMTEEEALKARINPINHLEPLAKAKIPLLHVVGDADPHVPVSENTAIVEKLYTKLGGQIEVIHKPGVGHVHGLKDPTPIVDFIIKNTAYTKNQ